MAETNWVPLATLVVVILIQTVTIAGFLFTLSTKVGRLITDVEKLWAKTEPVAVLGTQVSNHNEQLGAVWAAIRRLEDDVRNIDKEI